MKYLLTILFTIVSFTSFAQSVIQISGFIKDKKSNPIEGATIQTLTIDSVFLSGTTANAKGHFSLKGPRTRCIIKVTCLGYQKFYKSISLGKADQECILDTIKLQDESFDLDEVIIAGKAAAIQMKGDTLEYNTSIYTLSEQASVKDLLKLLPNVTVTDQGQILVQGKTVSKIFVDGKEFFSTDPEMASKSLPGKIVDKVQVIDQSSETARLTGFDSGKKETVLNLSVKEENKVGVMAQASVGGGHDINGNRTRYEQNGYINVLKKQNIFNIALQNDNTNNSTGSSQSGDNSTGRIGLSINKDFNSRFNLLGNATYRSMNSINNMLTDEQTMLTPESSLYDYSKNLSKSKNKNLDAYIKAEWNPNDKNTLIVQTYLNYIHNNNKSNELFSSFNNMHDTIYNGNSVTENKGDSYSLNTIIDYAYRLKKKGRVFSTSLNSTVDRGHSYESNFWNRKIYENNAFLCDSASNRQATNENSGKLFKLSLSYVEPIAKNQFMQLVYTICSTDNHINKSTYNIAGDILPDNFRLLSDQSPTVSQTSINQRLTLSYKSSGEKTDYTTGVNVDIDNSENETYLPDESLRSKVSQKVTNYSPVLNIKHRFDKSNTLTFDYVGTMTSPTSSQLQDYTDISNPINSIKGNPNLKPEFVNWTSLNVSGSSSITRTFYYISLFGRYTANAIQSSLKINPETGNRITSYKNINGNWNMQLQCTYYTPIKETRFTVGNMMRSGYNRKEGVINEEVSTMGYFTMDESPNIRYYTPDFEFNFRGLFKYVAIKNQTIFNSNMETFDWGAEISASYLLPYKIQFSSSFRWSLKKGYGEVGDIKETILDIVIQKNCFSKKYGTGTIQLSVFDLLQSRKQLSMSVGASSIQNTIASTMGSFFMCSFSYSFDFFSK